MLPGKVVKIIDSYCRSFVWSGFNTISRRALVSWEIVCTPSPWGAKSHLQLWNRAAIVETYWNLADTQNKMRITMK